MICVYLNWFCVETRRGVRCSGRNPVKAGESASKTWKYKCHQQQAKPARRQINLESVVVFSIFLLFSTWFKIYFHLWNPSYWCNLLGNSCTTSSCHQAVHLKSSYEMKKTFAFYSLSPIVHIVPPLLPVGLQLLQREEWQRWASHCCARRRWGCSATWLQSPWE